MRTKTTFSLLAALTMTLWPVVAGADIALVFRANHDGSTAVLTNGGTGAESFTLDSGPTDNVASTSYGYTIGNIDAAGDGTANDSLSAVFGISAAGGNVKVQPDGNFGVTGANAGNLNDVAESLTYSLLSSSVTLGDGGTGSVTGGGFNQIQFSNLTSDTETASLSGTDMDGSVTGTTTFSPVATFTVGHNDDGSNFRVGPARYRFVITTETATIPEPSSLMLFGGIAGLTVLRRARSRQG